MDWFLGNYLTHYIVDRNFPYPWSGLYLHPYHLRVRPKFSFLRYGPLNAHSVLQSSNCRSVVVQDKVVAEKLRISLTNKSIVLSPDVADLSSPATDCQLVKQIKEKARNRKIVGLLGSQGKRKGLLTMLKISQHLKEENFFLFLLENQVGNLSRLRK